MNTFLTLVPSKESKKKKKYEELWSKIRGLIRSIAKNHDDKHMKIQFNSDDELPLNKKIKTSSMIIVVRAVFHENKKHYTQVFFDKCLYIL